jgi:DNA-binding MarR family transcriptional regulator
MTPAPSNAAPVPVVDALAQVSFAVYDVLTKAASAHDLSVTQLRLLGILRDRTPSMAAIANTMNLDRSSVSGLIDRAEQRGFVARRTSTDDARVTLVDLTADGRSVALDLEATVGMRVGELLNGVSAADQAHFVRIAALLVSQSRR